MLVYLELYDDIKATWIQAKFSSKRKLTEQDQREIIYKIAEVHKIKLDEGIIETIIKNLNGF